MTNTLFRKLSGATARKTPLVLDGAIGSLLLQQGIPAHNELWLSFAPLQAVENVHRIYIEAGADIITTNTFRTNPAAFTAAGITSGRKELVTAMVRCAMQAREGNDIIIAGSNAPAEDCYSPVRTLTYNQLYENHSVHIAELCEAGVDCILNETIGMYDEALIIAKICSDYKIPFIISLLVTAEGTLLSGERASDVLAEVKAFNPLALSVNCVTPGTITLMLPALIQTGSYGFYANCAGNPLNAGDEFKCTLSSGEYLRYVTEVIASSEVSPAFTGTCCGSSPVHTAALAKYVRGLS